MIKTNRGVSIRSLVLAFLALGILITIASAAAHFGKRPIVAADEPTGPTKSVIVEYKDVAAVTTRATAERQRDAIDNAHTEVFDDLPYSAGYKLLSKKYENFPYASYIVDAEGEASLKSDPNVKSVTDNIYFAPGMYEVVETIGGSTTTGFSDGSTNYDGDGFSVAILDTGVLKTHDSLSGKVIAEACFNTNASGGGVTVSSRCPGGVESSTASGSGADCVAADATGCGHGTHVASIAASLPDDVTVNSNPETLSGVAKSADIIAVNVFSEVVGVSVCGNTDPCVRAMWDDILAALDYVLSGTIANSFSSPVAATNMSLGASPYQDNQTTCDTASSSMISINSAFASLRANGIAPVVSAGNDGDPNDYPSNVGKIGMPGCLSNAIAVASTNKAGNAIATYSNNGALVDILAPGGSYDGVNQWSTVLAASSEGVTQYTYKQGTSMAAPVVAGAFAVLREMHPNASVDQLLTLMQSSGVSVADSRDGYSVTKSRLRLAQALADSPYPTITSFSGPVGTVNEGAGILLEAEVDDVTTCSLNNGVGNVTVNAGVIEVTVPGAASYTLTCVNVYGDSVDDTVSFTLNPAPTVPVLTEQVHNETAGTFTLSWTASTDTDGVEEYRVYLNGQLVATLPNTATSYTFENLLAGVAYTAEVRAVDTLGAISAAASASFGGEVPGSPNTGVFDLTTSSGWRAVLVATLGLGIVVATFVIVRRRAHSR